jgi:hypothetical protein
MSNEEMGQATNLRSVQTPRTARSELSREQAQRLGGVVRNGDVLKSDARRECTSNARIATLIVFLAALSSAEVVTGLSLSQGFTLCAEEISMHDRSKKTGRSALIAVVGETRVSPIRFLFRSLIGP